MQKVAFYISYIPLRILSKFLPAKEALVLLLDVHKRVLTLIADRSSDYGDGVSVQHRLMNYHEFFTKRMTEGEKVLDIGSGIGYLAYDLAKAGAHVTGIEISEKNIYKANKLYKHDNLKFILGDAWKNLPKENFDTVVMSNVLEHIDDRVGFIKKVQKEIAPKRWLIRVPRFDRDWIVPLAQELGLDSRLDETHFTEFTPESFEQETGEAGLKISYIESRWGELWAELTPKNL